MPLADIRQLSLGDHWWYPHNTYWQARAEFGSTKRDVQGGGNKSASAKFRNASEFHAPR